MRKPIRGAALLLLVVPGITWGLGLGNIEVDTALNQPLSAEIRVLSLDPADVPDVRVSLAPQEAFDRIGLARPFVLSQLEFKPIVKPDGEIVIQVTSQSPIREPFLNFIVDVQWPAGHMLREYTILLDPPTLMEQRPVIAARPPAVERVVPDRSRLIERTAATPEPTRETVSTAASGRAYTTASGDTLSEVASNTFGADGADLPQFMLALLRANPDAFFENNINNLKAGAILRMPDRSEINTLTRDQALAEVSRQNAVWREYRTQLAQANEPQPVREETRSAAPAESPTESPIVSSADADKPPAPDAEAGVANAAASADNDAVSADNEGPAETTDAEDRLRILAAREADAESDIMLVAATGDVAALRDQAALAQELAQSRGQEIDELGARLRELESMLSKQQRIIDLQSNQLADLQQRYATEPLAYDGQITVPAATREPAEIIETADAAEPAAGAIPVEGDGVITVPAAERPSRPPAQSFDRPVQTAQSRAPVGGDGVIVVPAAARMEQGGGEVASEQGADAVAAAAQSGGEAMAADESPATETAGAGDKSLTTMAGAGASPAETASPLQPPAQADTGAAPSAGGFAGLLENTRLVAGLAGGVLLALLVGLFLYMKKQRAGSQDAGEDIYAAQEDIPASSGVATAAAVGGASGSTFIEPELFADADYPAARVESNQDDVLGEVDVYLAYGLHPQAIDLLKDSLAQDPARSDYRLKLLEAYMGAGDQRGFDTELNELHAALGNESTAAWKHAAVMAGTFSPDHPLLGGDGAVASVEAEPAVSDDETFDTMDWNAVESAASADDETAESAQGSSDEYPPEQNDRTIELSREELHFIDEQINESSAAPAAREREEAPADSSSALEFNVSSLDLEPPAAPEELDTARSPHDSMVIDFGPGESGIRTGSDPFSGAHDDESAVLEPEDEERLVVDLDDPTLLLGSAETAPADTGPTEKDSTLLQSSPDFTDTLLMNGDVSDSDTLMLDDELSADQELDGILIDGGDEVGTKLDLAKAFIDMGDSDGARSALEEVLYEGDNDQRKEAEGLIAQIA